jgi:hypothetical protein
MKFIGISQSDVQAWKGSNLQLQREVNDNSEKMTDSKPNSETGTGTVSSNALYLN